MPGRRSSPRPSPAQTGRLVYRESSAPLVPDGPDAEWLTLRRAAAMMGIHPNSFYQVFAAAKIRILEYPGMAPMYSREDIQKVIDGAVRVDAPARRPRKPRGVA